MENLKKGDVVEISSNVATYTIIAKTGNGYIVNEKPRNGIVKVDVAMFLRLNDVKKIRESQMQYKESKRYLLAQAVKEKVKLIKSKEVYVTAEILSLATGNSKTYFSTQSAKSKFLSRGDLSEKTYQAMLTDLAFAEREVLGIGAKTVDDSGINFSGTADLNINIDKYETWASDLNKNHAEEKPTSNKPLFIGVTLVIFIILILFILNNSQVI